MSVTLHNLHYLFPSMSCQQRVGLLSALHGPDSSDKFENLITDPTGENSPPSTPVQLSPPVESVTMASLEALAALVKLMDLDMKAVREKRQTLERELMQLRNPQAPPAITADTIGAAVQAAIAAAPLEAAPLVTNSHESSGCPQPGPCSGWGHCSRICREFSDPP